MRNPKRADAYRQRGIFWGDVGENGRAVTDFSNAIRLDPAMLRRTFCRGDLELARQIPTKPSAISMLPCALIRKTFALTRIAAAFGTRGDLDKALADSNAAIRLCPKSAEGYIVRGMVWSTRQEFDKAVRDYDLAIRLDPNNSSANHNRGVIYQHQGSDRPCPGRLYVGDQGRSRSGRELLFAGDDLAFEARARPALHDFNSAVQFDPQCRDVRAARHRLAAKRKAEPGDQGLERGDSARSEKRRSLYAVARAGNAGRVRQGPVRSRRGRAAEPEIMAGISPAGLDLVNDPTSIHRDGARAVKAATRACELTSWKDAMTIEALAAAHAETGNFAEAIQWKKKGARTVDPRQSLHDRRRAAAQTLQVEQAVPRRPELATGINQNICPGERGR